MRNHLSASSGFSLVEMIVAVGIMGVISLGMASMIIDQSRQTQGLQQKLMAVELETSLKQMLSSDDFCGCLMRGRTFNTTTNQFSSMPDPIPVSYAQPTPPMPTACVPNATNLISTTTPPSNNTLKASAIGLNNVVQLGVGSYKANFEVQIDHTSLIRALKPVTASFLFNVDPTNPTAATFLGCGGSIDPVSATVVRSPFIDGFNFVDCPAGKTMVSCHIEVNTGDGSSNFYRNRLQYSPATGSPTRCYSNMTDGSDTYQLVAICVQ